MHTFTTSGSFTAPNGVTSVRYLVVGGGGGGGGITAVNAGGAGGGGAGGFRAGTGFAVTPGTNYAITVGGGGTGAACGGTCTAGTNGGDSTFSTISAIGGGRGAYVGNNGGAAGGSGGGGRLNAGGTGGAGTGGQGNAGGSAVATGTAAAGGGGSSTTGANANTDGTGGNGGAGTSDDITGAPVTYAGGGGGGGYNAAGGSGGAGGGGSGGDGTAARSAGSDAAVNTGGGGGGANGSGGGAAFNGGNGAAGIVVIRYTMPSFYTRGAGGNWGTASTWSTAGCGGAAASSIPGDWANVTICAGDTVSVNVTTADLGTLAVAGTLNNTTNNRGVTVLNATVVSGTLTCAATNPVKSYQTLEVQNGGTVDLRNCNTTFNDAVTVRSGGTLQFTTSATGTKTFAGHVTIDAGGAWTSAINSTAVFQGGITNDGSFTSGSGTQTFNTNNQTIDGSGGMLFRGAVTLAAGILVTNGNTSTITMSGQLNGGSGASEWVNGANAYVSYAPGNTTQPMNTGILTASATGNTFDYARANAQTVKLPSGGNYYNLTLSGSGTKTPTAGTYNVLGNLTVSSGTVFQLNSSDPTLNVSGATDVSGTYTGSNSATATFGGALTISGTFTGGGGAFNVQAAFTNDGTFTSGAGTYTFNGSSPQTITGTNGGTTTFTRLALDNASGFSLSGTHDLSVVTLLSLTNGVITTGSNLVNVTGFCPGAIARTNGWVAGFLRVNPPTAGSVTCVIEVGDATSYRPASISFTTLTTPSGTVTGWVSQSAINDPNIASSDFDSTRTATRYWVLANTARFASATATFAYGADVSPIAAEDVFEVGRYSGSWSYLSTTPGTGSAAASGLTGAAGTNTLDGEFQIGERTSTAPSLFSHWRMDQFSWGGSSGEVLDSGTGSGGPYHGTASGLSGTHASTDNVSPALGNASAGTCYYGVFNRANKQFVDIPASFPKLTTSAGAFTVGAWIRTTDRTQPGQRIVIDDEAGVNGNWGFSLGDAGAGTVRFFLRQGTTFILDSASVINNNTWYYAAVVVNLAAGANNANGKIYVYDTSGSLVSSSGPTAFTWTVAGANPGGAPSIGGENNAAGGEATSAFGFSGNIDEVRVYRSALTAGQVQSRSQETRPCVVAPSVDHYELSLATTGISCLPTAIGVTACADAASPCSNKVTTISGQTALLSTSGGTVGSPVVFDATGVATTTLSHPAAADGSLVTVTLSGESTAAANPRKCCQNGSCSTSSSCSTTFNTVGFLFSSSADGLSATIPTQVAATASGTFYLRAVRTNTTTKACESALSAAATFPVDFSYTCSNPTTCSAGSWMDVTPSPGSATAVPGAVAMPFDANGNAPFAFNYKDVGAISINASATVNSAPLSGSSNVFVVKPATFTVVASGVPGDAATPSAAGTAYVKAGQGFTVTVTARNSAGTATPNYGKDTSQTGVTLSQTLVGGLGLSTTGSLMNGGIPDGSTWSSGSITADGTPGAPAQPSWNEVGYITLTASASNYLSAGIVTGTASANIGRFYPDRFAVSAVGSLTPACGTFSYLGQTFAISGVTLQAQNAAGGVTQNYNGAFAKHVPGPAANWVFGARDTTGAGSALTVDTSAASITGSWSNGQISPAISGIAIARSSVAPGGPFPNTRVGIAPTDSDGVTIPSGSFDFSTTGGANDRKQVGTTMETRYGRLRIVPAAGAANLDLRVPLRVEYWNGGAFAINTSDNCTALAAVNVGLSGYATNRSLASGDTSVTPATISFTQGSGTIILTKPAGQHEGSVLLTPALGAAGLSYLQGAWGSVGTYTADPSGRAAFGIYGAQPRQFIFQRENY